jgi:spore coat polysaccharide biosynthesis predicted glycosyltransferase SpsG
MHKEVFQLFSKKEGAQHIASEYALMAIEKIVKQNNIHSVFEFGIGIGTIPYLLSTLNKRITYYGTEENEFCNSVLPENLGQSIESINYNAISSYLNFNDENKFDFIIIDGLFDDANFLKKIAHDNTLIFVEGDRENQREFLRKTFPKCLINRSISLNKNSKHSPYYDVSSNHFVGGYTLFRLNPNFRNKTSWFLEKIATSLKYKLRMII